LAKNKKILPPLTFSGIIIAGILMFYNQYISHMRNKLCLLAYFCCLHFFALMAKEKRIKNPQQVYADSAVILIPFEFQQSALYHTFTYEVIDSVVNLLLTSDKITLSIKGFAHEDEGTDSICKWLSDDRALFVKKYILGRGVSEGRIAFTTGMGAEKSIHSNINKNNKELHFRAELILNFPPPPPPIIADRDEDGILNEDDTCPDLFGYNEKKGCPDTNAVIIPFGSKEDWLSSFTYSVLDSVVVVLQKNKVYTITVEGHAFKTEGTVDFCNNLAANRADLVKKYLLSRNISSKRITSLNSFGINRPINAAKNHKEEVANSRVQIFIHQ
jgi:outer membrane protein OmpA-like peptidoglycan-associated protein